MQPTDKKPKQMITVNIAAQLKDGVPALDIYKDLINQFIPTDEIQAAFAEMGYPQQTIEQLAAQVDAEIEKDVADKSIQEGDIKEAQFGGSMFFPMNISQANKSATGYRPARNWYLPEDLGNRGNVLGAVATAAEAFTNLFGGKDTDGDGLKDGSLRNLGKKRARHKDKKGEYFSYEVEFDPNDPNIDQETGKNLNYALNISDLYKGKVDTLDEYKDRLDKFSRINVDPETGKYTGIISADKINKKLYSDEDIASLKGSISLGDFQKTMAANPEHRALLAQQLGLSGDEMPEGTTYGVDKEGFATAYATPQDNPYLRETMLGQNIYGQASDPGQQPVIPVADPTAGLFMTQDTPPFAPKQVQNADQQSFRQWYAKNAIRLQGKNEAELRDMFVDESLSQQQRGNGETSYLTGAKEAYDIRNKVREVAPPILNAPFLEYIGADSGAGNVANILGQVPEASVFSGRVEEEIDIPIEMKPSVKEVAKKNKGGEPETLETLFTNVGAPPNVSARMQRGSEVPFKELLAQGAAGVSTENFKDDDGYNLELVYPTTDVKRRPTRFGYDDFDEGYTEITKDDPRYKAIRKELKPFVKKEFKNQKLREKFPIESMYSGKKTYEPSQEFLDRLAYQVENKGMDKMGDTDELESIVKKELGLENFSPNSGLATKEQLKIAKKLDHSPLWYAAKALQDQDALGVSMPNKQGGGEATNLYEYYKALGEQLPNMSMRRGMYMDAGLGNQYSGTAQQNADLLNYLQNETEDPIAQTIMLDEVTVTAQGNPNSMIQPLPIQPIEIEAPDLIIPQIDPTPGMDGSDLSQGAGAGVAAGADDGSGFADPKVKRKNKFWGSFNYMMDSPGMEVFRDIGTAGVAAAGVINEMATARRAAQARQDMRTKLTLADRIYGTYEERDGDRGMWDINTGLAQPDNLVVGYAQMGKEVFMNPPAPKKEEIVDLDMETITALIAAGADIEIL